MKNKFLAILLSFGMVLSLLPGVAFATDEPENPTVDVVDEVKEPADVDPTDVDPTGEVKVPADVDPADEVDPNKGSGNEGSDIIIENGDGTLLTEPPVEALMLQVEPADTVNDAEALQKAIEDPAVDTITLGSSFAVDITNSKENSAAIVIDRNLTIEGNNHTLSVGTVSVDKKTAVHVLGIESKDSETIKVTINDLTINANGGTGHALNVFTRSGETSNNTVTLNNVTLENATKAGMVVNNSTVTATKLTTSGNAWGGVNVDKGNPEFTFDSNSEFDEDAQIWTEIIDRDVVTPPSGWTSFTNGSNQIQYTSRSAVAQTDDGDIYPTLLDAISAVESGETITMLKDITLVSYLEINTDASNAPKKFTLDLDGHTITAEASINVSKGANLTIKDSGSNGTIKFTEGTVTQTGNFAIIGNIYLENSGAIDTTVTLKSGTITSSNNNGTLIAKGNGATFIMDGGSVMNTYKGKTDGHIAVTTNGNRNSTVDNGNVTITINDGLVKSSYDAAMYLPSSGKYTITGGTIEGRTGIEIDSGTLDISGDAVIKSIYNGDGTRAYKDPDNDGNYNFGTALAIVSKGSGDAPKGYYGHMNINIDGGTFISDSYYAIDEYNLKYVQGGSKDEKLNEGHFTGDGLNITGGNFYGAKGAILSDTQTEFITGGYYTPAPTDSYLFADGETVYVTVPSDNKDNDSTRNYDCMVEEKKANAPEVVAGPSEAESKVEGDYEEDAETLAKTISGGKTDAPALANIATSIAQGKDTNTLIDQAKPGAVQEAKILFNTDNLATKDGLEIVIEPYLDIEITGLNLNTAATEILTLEIEALYNVVATTGKEAMVKETDPENPGKTINAVNLLTEQPMKVTTPVAVTIPLTKDIADALTSENLYVLHKDTYYYEATVDSTSDSKTLTFTTTNGFSPFTLISDDRSATVAFDDGSESPTTKGLNCADINVANALPSYKGSISSGEYFAGWVFVDENGDTIPDADGTHTILTSKLLTALSDYVGDDLTKIIKANPVFLKSSTSRPSGGGNGGSVIAYKVTTEDSTNGTITTNKGTAVGDATVTITAIPDTGYALDKLVVTDGDGNKLKLTDNGDGTFSFEMPTSKVTIDASFVKASDVPATDSSNFVDVFKNDWYYDAVQYAFDNDLMSGISSTQFGPNGTTTRGMIVTILHRLEGKPATSGSTFTDVANGNYYTDAVAWAAANNIVGGYGDGTFGPMDNITREQLAAIMYRYASYKGYDVTGRADLTSYSDDAQVSNYALDAMQWANFTNLITGDNLNALNPSGDATRAQVAAIMMRFCENIAK